MWAQEMIYLNIIVCVDACGALSCLEIAPNEEPDL